MTGRPGLTEKRLSVHRFQQLPGQTGDGMLTPGDVTIDIPLQTVPSQGQTGARKGSVNTHTSARPYEASDEANVSNEKNDVGPGLRKRIDSARARSLDDPEDGTVTTMGRIYQKIFQSSIIVRYFIYILPVAILIAVPMIVGALAAPKATIGGVPLVMFFGWFEVVWWALWICKLFARYLPYIFQFLCGIVSSGTRKYALILQALQLPIATVLWALISLITFLPMMTYSPQKKAQGDTSVKSWEKSVKNVLFALFVCSLIFLGEKLIVQLISISYHRKQFDTKIKESKRNVYLLAQLFDASRTMFPMYCKEFREEDSAISDLIAAKAGMPRSGSAPWRLIRNVGQNVGRFGDKVTAAFGDVAHELTGKEVFNPTSARSIVTLALERRRSSEALARRIWMSFVIEGRDALLHDDVSEVLGAGKELEAEECFRILDRDGNGDISLDEMILAVQEVARTKKALNHSLHDVDQAIHVLDNLLLSVAFIIGILVFVSFVTSGFGTVIAAAATSLLSLSFVFSTTAQEVLGSCIFLFVKHPFDVGDRVEVSDKSYMVERISLLFTVFRNVNDHRTTQVPNAVLNTLWIDNFTRSAAMHEVLTISVNFDTGFSDIQALKEEMETFVRDKENARDYQADVHIDVVGVGDMDKMELSVTISHKSNWSNDTIRASRRSKFMCALISAVRKLSIRGPAAAAAEEEAADPETNDDDKPDAPAGSNQRATDDAPKRMDTGISRRRDPNLPSEESKSTGADFGRSSNSLQRRHGGVTTSSSYSEGNYPEPITNRSPGDGPDADNYQTPNASPGNDHLSVPFGSLSREISTGRRKEGARVSSYPTATGGVPILSQPVPPRQAEHQHSTSDHNQYAAAQFYDPQGVPYDSTQTYELPSMVETSPGVYQQYPDSPNPPSSIQPSPTNMHFADEQMPGSFVSRRQQGQQGQHPQ
ncbi:hypothetical protein FE257_011221 [Aspergillus nanangensis]|uniref:EF-hand domain-containing protein n=1 Tax=Aspergillus nanangensis TaxID=2582783 RepID=A0AAD4GRM4_ASPNN|nr:hypothetical protein FE257_011221 [Aspergillus nanangensis]